MSEPKSETAQQLVATIEHTLLKPQAQRSHIENLCAQADKFGFHGVCVNPFWARVAVEALATSPSKVVSVVGFPLGANHSSQKALEARHLSSLGCDELDMVINVGALKDGQEELVLHDIRGVKNAAPERPLKVIIETGLLTQEEKVTAIKICNEAQVDFIKTCTGFNDGRATVEDIELIRSLANKEIQIKASAGIKTQAHAMDLIQAGANRLGTSSGVQLALGESSEGGY